MKATKPAPKATKPRKVIQIAIGPGEHWLLCDDSTVWIGNPGNWTEADITTVLNAPTPAAKREPAP